MPKILSIEIDNRYIKIVEASRKINGEFLSINKFLSLNIPPDCIEDGKIINMSLVRDKLKNALLKNQIKTKKAIFVINPNAVITRKLKLPILKRKSQTMSMIKIEFEQLISTNLNQMVIYKKVDYVNEDLINESKYIVYGLSRNVFNQYIELSKMLKLKLVSLKTSSSCLEMISKNSLMINKSNFINRIVAYVYVSHSYIVFCVIKDGIDDFSRVIYFNPDEREMYNIDRVAESSSYIHLDLNINSSKSDVDINILSEEISKNIRYYGSMDKDNNIEKIYIYGNSKENRIEEFEDDLSIVLNADVEIIKEISKLDVCFPINEFDFIEYFHAFLSLFTDKKDINFLTDEIQRIKIKFYFGIFILSMAVCIVLMLSKYYKMKLIENELLNNEIETMAMFMNSEKNIRINNEIKEIKNDIAYLEDYKKHAIKVKEIIYNNNNVSSPILREIASVTPDGTDINSIVMGENNIQMKCKSNYVEEVIIFLGSLRDINSVVGVYIPLIKYNVDGNDYSYSVICKLEDVSLNEVE